MHTEALPAFCRRRGESLARPHEAEECSALLLVKGPEDTPQRDDMRVVSRHSLVILSDGFEDVDIHCGSAADCAFKVTRGEKTERSGGDDGLKADREG